MAFVYEKELYTTLAKQKAAQAKAAAAKNVYSGPKSFTPAGNKSATMAREETVTKIAPKQNSFTPVGNKSAILAAQEAGVAKATIANATKAGAAPVAAIAPAASINPQNPQAVKSTNTGGSTSTGAVANTNAAPAATTVEPGYNGLTDDQYRQHLISAVKAGVMTEYEANASIIKNNLSKALSDLQAEKAALDPLYQNRLGTIASNQFATSEATKETMNQGGWNASNSGLAVGEQSKIAMAADKNRATAMQDKTTAESDINRRSTLANEEFGTNLASLEAQKNAKLAGAEAEAMVKADERNRSMYESDRSFNMQQQQFAESVRQFNTQLADTRAARSASAKAAAAKAEASASAAEKEQYYNTALSGLYAQSTQQDAQSYLKNVISDEGIPDSVKTKLIKDADAFIKSINADGTVYNPNNEYIPQ